MTILAWEPAVMSHEPDLRRPELPGDEIALLSLSVATRRPSRS